MEEEEQEEEHSTEGNTLRLRVLEEKIMDGIMTEVTVRV